MSTTTLIHAPVRRLPARPATAPTVGAVRLTRRGRLVVLALALVAVLLLGVFLTAGSVATDEPGTPVPTEVVMVGSGDTLWGIAAEAAEGGDVRDMVERIQQLNHLDTGMVTLGQRLRVPTQG